MSLRVNILLKYKLLINFSFDIYCMYEGQFVIRFHYPNALKVYKLFCLRRVPIGISLFL